jgi:NAD(P)-dependent dehydrogenase (short-subunit alcohol dehydrogenase family)
MCKRLEGKVALVTGSTSGIGKATAKLFAAHGARVVVTGRRTDWGERAIKEITAQGGEARYFACDLAESQAVRDLVAFTVESFGGINILVNNAFYRVMGTVVDVREEDWDLSMAVTLKAPYLACQAAIPHMIHAGGGSIINVSSVHAAQAASQFFVYDVAKAGMTNMMRQIAIDFGQYGIRANALCPGRVIVERSENLFIEDPTLEDQVKMAIPLRKIARPLDIAHAALFLASDESALVTGTTLYVDGGSTCQLVGDLYMQFEAHMRKVGWQPPAPKA